MLSRMSESTFIVTGMSCGHCAQSVTGEITGLAGVSDVTVDVATGRVTVRSEVPLSESDVHAAVEEAGYQLAESVTV